MELVKAQSHDSEEEGRRGRGVCRRAGPGPGLGPGLRLRQGPPPGRFLFSLKGCRLLQRSKQVSVYFDTDRTQGGGGHVLLLLGGAGLSPGAGWGAETSIPSPDKGESASLLRRPFAL